MSSSFRVRRATSGDIPVLARHRAEMFRDMGKLPDSLYQPLVEATTRYYETAVPSEEYVAWLAAPADHPGEIVAGAGVQRWLALPRPLETTSGWKLSHGRQGVVVNVFTERPWRRRGIAALLMDEVMAWARASDLEVLVLHASDEGRPLYERLGFVPTNEMRFAGDLD